MARADDDALTWDGDDDPTLTTDSATRLPEGWRTVGGAGQAAEATSDDAHQIEASSTTEEPPPVDDESSSASMGNASLIATGIMGGIYLLFAVGWLIGGLRLHAISGFLVSSDGTGLPTWSAGNLVAVWVAALAPLIWFGTVFALTRESRSWVRWVLLVVGAILLLPWPFIMVGAVGS